MRGARLILIPLAALSITASVDEHTRGAVATAGAEKSVRAAAPKRRHIKALSLIFREKSQADISLIEGSLKRHRPHILLLSGPLALEKYTPPQMQCISSESTTTSLRLCVPWLSFKSTAKGTSCASARWLGYSFYACSAHPPEEEEQSILGRGGRMSQNFVVLSRHQIKGAVAHRASRDPELFLSIADNICSLKKATITAVHEASDAEPFTATLLTFKHSVFVPMAPEDRLISMNMSLALLIAAVILLATGAYALWYVVYRRRRPHPMVQF